MSSPLIRPVYDQRISTRFAGMGKSVGARPKTLQYFALAGFSFAVHGASRLRSFELAIHARSNVLHNNSFASEASLL